MLPTASGSTKFFKGTARLMKPTSYLPCSIRLKAPAKLNLYLNVQGKRKDGYHTISSVMEKISLFDELKVMIDKKNSIELFCNEKELQSEKNLAFKAAELFKDRFRIKRGIKIFLAKRIPQGSGLGGASSDAASVLLALNRLFNLNFKREKLLSLGARLGSDVNFFLYRHSFAYVTGKGQIVHPIESSLKLKHLLILTKQAIATQEVYNAFRLHLTKHLDNAKLVIHSLMHRDKDLLEKLLFNSLTKAYLDKSHKGRAVFSTLSKLDDCPFFLSGSGSTVAVILEQPDTKRKIKTALRNLGVKVQEVTTY